eukprot:g9532.t1
MFLVVIVWAGCDDVGRPDDAADREALTAQQGHVGLRERTGMLDRTMPHGTLRRCPISFRNITRTAVAQLSCF